MQLQPIGPFFLNRLLRMNLQRYFLFLLVIPFLFACDEQDSWEKQPDAVRGIVFHLTEEPFDGETLQTTKSTGEFSRVEHLIVTEEGEAVPNIKSTYLPDSRKIGHPQPRRAHFPIDCRQTEHPDRRADRHIFHERAKN